MGPNKEELLQRYLERKALLEKEVGSTQPALTKPSPQELLEQYAKRLETLQAQQTSAPSTSKEEGFSWGRFIPEALAKGFSSGVGSIPSEELMMRVAKQNPEQDLSEMMREVQGVGARQHEAIQNAPILNTQEPGTMFQRLADSTIKGIGASATFPLGGFLPNAAYGAAAGLASGSLEEMGVPQPYAAIAGGFGPAVGVPLARGVAHVIKNPGQTLRKLNPLPGARGEQQAQRDLMKTLDAERIPQYIEELSNPNANLPLDGYEPLTAQLTTSPEIARLNQAAEAMSKHPDLPRGVQDIGLRQKESIAQAVDKLTPEGGYTPQATKDALIAEHEARVAAHAKEMESVKDKARTTVKNELGEAASYAEVGEELESALKKELKDRRKTRTATVGKRYEQLAKLTMDYTNKKGDTTKLPLAIVPKKARKYFHYLTKEANLGSEFKKKYGHLMRGSRNLTPVQVKTKDGLQVVERIGGSPVSRLESQGLQALGDDISAARNAHRHQEATLLTDFKKKLEADLRIAPQVKETRATWKEASKGVNEILEHPVFKKLVKTPAYDTEGVTLHSHIPDQILQGGEKGESIARQFLNVAGKDPQAMDAMHRFVNTKALEKIVDADGLPDMAKIAKFKKDNPTFFILDPHLETKLSNSSNAAKFVNDTAAALEKEINGHYKEMFKSLSGESAKNFVPTLFGSSHADEKINLVLDRIKNHPQAQAGLQRGIIDYTVEHSPTPAKFMKFFDAHKEKLAKRLPAEQMQTLESVYEAHKRTFELGERIRTRNSTTAMLKTMVARLDHTPNSILGGFSNLGSVTAAASGKAALVPAIIGTRWYKNLKRQSYTKTLHRMLTDHNYTKAVIQDLSTPAGRKAAQDLSKQWRRAMLSGYAIKEKDKKDDDL